MRPWMCRARVPGSKCRAALRSAPSAPALPSAAYPRWLTTYGRVTGDARRVQAGEYRIDAGTTPAGLLAKLVAGEVFLHQLTVVEGWRFAEFLAALRAHPAIIAGNMSGAEIMTELGAPEVHPEGQFYPDTYRFPNGTPEIEVLRAAHAALQDRLDTAWQNRNPDTQLQTPYEALILASIIEKETALASERGLIAGVFHQRLARGMRLQTDPTVIYGIGESFDGNLRSRDLASDRPYKTTLAAGCRQRRSRSPGVPSLEAAVAPEITDALYFVAKGRRRQPLFSATLEEHDRAVDYLRASCGEVTMRGNFITLEGLDGAAKRRTSPWPTLPIRGNAVVMTREPGGTGLGEKIRIGS